MRQIRRIGRRLPGQALLAAMALALPSAALAQTTTSSLTGTVRSATGPLAGASVVAVAAGTGYRQVATAGADGRYVLSGLAPGPTTSPCRRTPSRRRPAGSRSWSPAAPWPTSSSSRARPSARPSR